ncbi:MAG TPA: sulfotransferase [Jatrophihabitans sp.]|nr:sulfotransferase [Jatrophihabitans sp.]
MSEPSPIWRRAARSAALQVPPIRRLVDERAALLDRQHRLEKSLADQRKRIQKLQQAARAPRAVAVNTAGRETELNYLFIVTYGRSGSTLLQGLIGSIPGYLIRGENRAACYRLYQCHHQLVTAKTRFSKAEPLTSQSSWYGIDGYAEADALDRMRSLVLDTLLKPEPDTRTIGFKEIRWFQPDWKQYLDFLRELFPGVRFVINTRDHASVVKSDWWSKDQEHSLKLLREYEQILQEAAAHLGNDAYRVHYDDYVADRNRLAGLFEWLGEEFDRARVDEVMSLKHSFGPNRLTGGATVA